MAQIELEAGPHLDILALLCVPTGKCSTTKSGTVGKRGRDVWEASRGWAGGNLPLNTRGVGRTPSDLETVRGQKIFRFCGGKKDQTQGELIYRIRHR